MQNLMSVVLAAGKGTRLQSEENDLPKVMRQAVGKPLLQYVLDSIAFIEKSETVLVVGYKKEEIIKSFSGYAFAHQEEQLGTGHAVMAAANALADFDGDVLICYGDMPLLTRDTYLSLVNEHKKSRNDCTVLTGTSDLSLPYGRIVRDENGGFLRVVEDRDCTEQERAITELNIGVYVFNSQKLLAALKLIGNKNAQGEYYVTDVPEILLAQGAKVGICKLELGPEIIGVNTTEQLDLVEKIITERLK